MLSPAVRTRPALAVLTALAALLGAGCAGTGGDDQNSGFRLTFTSGTLTATSEVVYVRLRHGAGSLITLSSPSRPRGASPAGRDRRGRLYGSPNLLYATSGPHVNADRHCRLPMPTAAHP